MSRGEQMTRPKNSSRSSATSGSETGTTGGSTSSTSLGSTTEEPSTSSSGDGGSSTGVASECGNGVVEGDEECDDGNESDFDECDTTCTTPACDDGVFNGSESSMDCGGSCSPCALCATCLVNTDCDSGLCNSDGVCGVEQQLTIDSRINCNSQPSPNSDSATLANLPAGTYMATAVNSAWNAYDTANPPDTGWTYFTPCDGMDLQQMRTPDGVRYSTPAEAFGAILTTSEEFQFAGGSISCSRVDNNCSDNQGAVIFNVSLVCADN